MQGSKWPIILLACGPCVVIVNLLGQVCTLGRAPRTKETLPDLHEWCRVTQHPRIFRELTGSQQTPRFWGVTRYPQDFRRLMGDQRTLGFLVVTPITPVL